MILFGFYLQFCLHKKNCTFSKLHFWAKKIVHLVLIILIRRGKFVLAFLDFYLFFCDLFRFGEFKKNAERADWVLIVCLFEFYLCIRWVLIVCLFVCDRVPGVRRLLLRISRFHGSSARQVTLWSYFSLPSFIALDQPSNIAWLGSN